MKLIDYLNQPEIKSQLKIFMYNGLMSGKVMIRLQMTNEYYLHIKEGVASYKAQKKVADKHDCTLRTVRNALEFMQQNVTDPETRKILLLK